MDPAVAVDLTNVDVAEVRSAERAEIGAGRAREGVTPASWLLVLACLNVVDLLTTQAVVDRGGQEGNPVMAPLVEHGWGAWGLKAVVLALTAALVIRCPFSRRLAFALMVVNTWYAVVVCWNVQMLAYV